MNTTFRNFIEENTNLREENIDITSGVDNNGEYDVIINITYEWDEAQLVITNGVIDLKSANLNTNKLKDIYKHDLPETHNRDLLGGKILIDTEYVQLLLDARGKLTIHEFKVDELDELIVSQM